MDKKNYGPVKLEPPRVIVKTSKDVELPCIATTLKDGEIMYLLDSSGNLVYCDKTGLFSLNLDNILNTFKDERKPKIKDDKFYRNDYTNNCAIKIISLETVDNLLEEPNRDNFEKFILNEVRINGDILNKYNLTDISLNKFEGTRVFRDPFNIGLSSQPPKYQELNNNEKKRLACGLYYYFISEVVTFPKSLTTYLEKEAVKNVSYNETNSIIKYYTDNRRNISKNQIHKLNDFQDIFTYKKPEEKKGLDGGAIAAIVIVPLIFIGIVILIIWYNHYRKPTVEAIKPVQLVQPPTIHHTNTPKIGHA
jgi:hypothetical protein